MRSTSVAFGREWHPDFAAYLNGGWRDYLAGPDMERTKKYMPHPTATSGVYFLFRGDDLLYVGLSVQVTTRTQEHAKRSWNVPFDNYGAISVPERLLRNVETAYIYSLYPPENTNYAPATAPNHDEMVTEIRRIWSRQPPPQAGESP